MLCLRLASSTPALICSVVQASSSEEEDGEEGEGGVGLRSLGWSLELRLFFLGMDWDQDEIIMTQGILSRYLTRAVTCSGRIEVLGRQK